MNMSLGQRISSRRGCGVVQKPPGRRRWLLSIRAISLLNGKCGRLLGMSYSKGEFDLVHRITPMSPTLPSPMASWSPAPFVLGPLNGGLKWPSAFREELAREREWLSYVRGIYRLLPYQNSTYRRSSAILAAFKHTIDDLPKHLHTKVFGFPRGWY